MRLYCVPDEEIQDDLRGNLDLQARLLYGLIHARWIVTARGLAKMVCKLLCPLISSLTYPLALLAFVAPRLPSLRSSRSTSAQTLAAAHACSASHNLSSP